MGIDDVDPSRLLEKNRLRIQAIRSALSELLEGSKLAARKSAGGGGVISLPPVVFTDAPRGENIEKAFQTQLDSARGGSPRPGSSNNNDSDNN